MSMTGYFAMAEGQVVRNPLLNEIGRALGKSAAQVALRWQVQKPRVVVLTKTSRIERLAENLSIFDFELTPEHMRAIDSLARHDGRIVSPPDLAPNWD